MFTFTSLLVICLMVLVVLYGWMRWKHRRIHRAANKMEGIFPICFPILGHIPYTMFGMERATDWALHRLVELLTRGVVISSLWIGHFPLPIIGGVKNVQKVLNSSCTSEKGDEMRYLECYGGYGLLNAPGNIWKIKRRYINPLFHPCNLELMMPTFNQNSKELVQNLSKHVGQGPFDVKDYVMDTALKTICHLIFGPDVNFDMTSGTFKGLRRIVERIPEIFLNRVIRIWLRVEVIFQFLYKKELNDINKLLQEFTETPLKIAKGKHEEKLKRFMQYQNIHETKDITTDKSQAVLTNIKNSQQNNMVAEVGCHAKHASKLPSQVEPFKLIHVWVLLNLIDVHSLLEEKFPQFTETDLKNEMITLYATGTDTIGGAVSSCLLLLAHYQDIQERLYKEIAGVDGDVTLSDIQNLLYLNQVYKECLRWTMIVPGVARKTSEDLKLNDVTIPAGYTVYVAIGANHWDPNIFPDPLSFDPERFSSKNVAERERYSFLPFSGGPRNCIGQHYTNMLMKVMLVHILKRYKIYTEMDVHNLRKKMVITLVSAEGYKIILENR